MREMLRIKRSVQATFNTQVNFMSTQMLVAQNSVEAAEAAQGGGATTRTHQSLPSITFYLLCVFSGDEMAKLEAKARQLAEESAQDQPQGDKGILFVRSVQEQFTLLTRYLAFVSYSQFRLDCRSNTTDEELGEMTKTNNPEEINIDSENESEGEAPQGMTSFLALFPFRSGDQERATGKYFFPYRVV